MLIMINYGNVVGKKNINWIYVKINVNIMKMITIIKTKLVIVKNVELMCLMKIMKYLNIYFKYQIMQIKLL